MGAICCTNDDLVIEPKTSAIVAPQIRSYKTDSVNQVTQKVVPSQNRFQFSADNTASSLRSKFLVETDEVQSLIDQGSSSVRFINATWYPGGGPVDAKEQHEEQRLTQGTQYFSHSVIANTASGLPNTLPSPEVFTEHMHRLRISKDNQIVCYDTNGISTVCRAAWMLRYFGASNVRIMNGGLKKWLKEGRKVYSGSYTDGETLPEDGEYGGWAVRDPSMAITEIGKIHEIAGKLYHGDETWQITDARPPAKFNEEISGPNGARPGKINGSVNIPCGLMVNGETGCLKSEEELAEIFAKHSVDVNKQTVHSCNSGVTACIVQLGFNVCNEQAEKSAIYDGSFSEYAKHEEPDFSKSN